MERFTKGEGVLSPRMPPFPFAVDIHPGPFSSAQHDAQAMNRNLVVLLYCPDNPCTELCVQQLNKPDVARLLRDAFVFLPVNIYRPDGWGFATRIAFHTLPMICVVRPRGEFHPDHVFAMFPHPVTEGDLIATLQLASPQRARADPIAQVQDEEYALALAAAEEHDDLEDGPAPAPAPREPQSRAAVDAAFSALPSGPGVSVRFMIPGMPAYRHSFPREAPVGCLFVVARKFVWPRGFRLFAGFPQREIFDSEMALSEAFSGGNFVVHVDLEE
jgi:hypothetical protein